MIFRIKRLFDFCGRFLVTIFHKKLEYFIGNIGEFPIINICKFGEKIFNSFSRILREKFQVFWDVAKWNWKFYFSLNDRIETLISSIFLTFFCVLEEKKLIFIESQLDGWTGLSPDGRPAKYIFGKAPQSCLSLFFVRVVIKSINLCATISKNSDSLNFITFQK